MSGRYELARHFGAWTVIDHANYDGDRPVYLSRAAAVARCRDLNDQQTRRMHPQPTLFDKDIDMTEPAAQPSIWDEIDGGDFRRDDSGKPLIIPVGGGEPVAYSRCTSWISAVEDDYGIAQWKRHLTVDGTLQPEFDADAWRDADWHTKKALCEAAFSVAGGYEKANRGTRMHALTDIDDAGDAHAPDVTPAELADLAAYRDAVRPFTLVHAEVRTVHDDLHVAGTPDRVWEYQGRRYIGDLKTGKIDGRKCAMQTALYAHSRLYDVATGTRTDLDVDLERALIVHLPYGEAKARVLWVDIAAGWEGVQLCAEVHAWRKRNGLTSVFKAPTVDDLIATATSDAALKALWASHRDDWTDAHTAAAKARLTALTAEVAA